MNSKKNYLFFILPSLLTLVYFLLPKGFNFTFFFLSKCLFFILGYLELKKEKVSERLDKKKKHLPDVSGAQKYLFILGSLVVAATVFWASSLIDESFFKEVVHLVYKKLAHFNIESKAQILWIMLGTSFINSLIEELYWRIFIYYKFKDVMSINKLFILGSIFFSLHHVVTLSFYLPQNSYFLPLLVTLSLVTSIGAALWHWMYLKTKSLMTIWVSHIICDVGIMGVIYQYL